jgi:hypothetical protein
MGASVDPSRTEWDVVVVGGAAAGYPSRRCGTWSRATGRQRGVAAPPGEPERGPAEDVTASERDGHLHDLVIRIAAGDGSAFRTLYASLAMRVWRDVSRSMPHPVDSQAVTRSTFIDVWHLARHHLDGGADTDVWIGAIAARKVEERLRGGPARGDRDRHTYREFAALISGGGTPSPPD